eukprot:gene11463-15355_t
MTGITDLMKNAKKVYWKSKTFLNSKNRRFLPKFLVNIIDTLVKLLSFESDNGEPDPIGTISMPRLDYFIEKKIDDDHVKMEFLLSTKNSYISKSYKWGLLFPICYRGEDKDACWQRIETFIGTLSFTTSPEDLQNIEIFIAIDKFDLLYDNPDAISKLEQMFLSRLSGVTIHICILRTSLRGKLCFIWNALAQQAVRNNCDFFVFLGDDVKLESKDWKLEVESQFKDISETCGLPFGVGCVCFRDKAFRVFPTFPVIHRNHMDAFSQELFPKVFINQHGDPYLFELYRRWGASRFAKATLVNTIGGAGKARYEKEGVRWSQETLSHSISKLSNFLNKSPTHVCMNIVVPSYRCDVSMLSRIAGLKMSRFKNSSVQVLIVVDNPVCENKNELLSLEDWSNNHLVRLWFQEINMGASLSRNTGMAQSFGEWCVLLDDDVLPDENILDNYYAVSCQYPKAQILVGQTDLPLPQSILEKSLIASQISFFYGVSEKMRNPPWGVTANICVRGRMNDVWFSCLYPNTGGGEDVDFCIRTKNLLPEYLRRSCIVSAPKAKVLHPFWKRIYPQVMGWAKGDTVCLSQLPHSTFYAPPNWIECISLFLVVNIMRKGMTNDLNKKIITIICIGFAEIILSWLNVLPNARNQSNNILTQNLIALLAIFPAMLQDFSRLKTKLINGRIFQLFLHFDWMDGQNDHVGVTRFSLLIKNVVYGIVIALAHNNNNVIQSILSLILITILLFWSKSQIFSEGAYKYDYVKSFLPIIKNNINSTSLFPIGQPFVVLAYQRTGSNWVCGRLHNHRSILMHSELFNEQRIYYYHDKDGKFNDNWIWDIFTRDKNPQLFLNDIFSLLPFNQSSFKTTPKAVGFKLFPEHWKGKNEYLFRRLVADPNIKKVILRRNSLLELYTSKLRADRTGNYIGVSLDDEKVSIDPAAFRSFIDNYRSVYMHYDNLCIGQNSSSVFKISYEDLMDEKQGEHKFSELLDFIGVSSEANPSSLKVTIKQSSSSLLSEKIINYDEIINIFKDELYF